MTDWTNGLYIHRVRRHVVLVEVAARYGLDGSEYTVTYVTPHARGNGSLIVGAPTKAYTLNRDDYERLV
jgi:hypothetical protein